MRGYKYTVSPCFSAITKTTVNIELAEAATATPEANAFAVLANGQANAVKEVKAVAGDTTKKKFELTLTTTLDKTQGTLSVNGKEKAFDFKTPSFVGVEAVAKNQLTVTFDEGLSQATAANFTVTSLADATWNGAGSATASSAVIQSDKTKVLVTLPANMVAGQNNYSLQLADNAVKDILNPKGNVAFQVLFNGTGEADALAPALLSASYEKATKTITVNFNKVTAAALTATKVSITDGTTVVEFTSADTFVQDGTDKTKFTATLTDATKAKVDPLTGTLTLVIAKDAVADAVNANLKNNETTAVLSIISAPEFVVASSSYDENTGILTLAFSTAVTIPDVSKITLGSVPTAMSKANDKVQEKVASQTLNIALSQATRDAIQDVAAQGKLKVNIPVGAVQDTSTPAVANSVAYANKEITFTQDTTKPVLQSAVYKNADASLTLTFSEPVRNANIAAAKWQYVTDAAGAKTDNAGGNDLTATKVEGNTIVLTVGGAETAFKNNYIANKELAIYLLADAVTDNANTGVGDANGNAAMTKAQAIAVAFVDTSIPALDTNSGVEKPGVTALLSKTQLQVTFNTPMKAASTTDADSVTNIANWTIKDATGATIPVTSVLVDASNPKVVYVNTSTDMATAAPGTDKFYTATVVNVRSLANILIGSTGNFVKFNGIATAADTAAPTIADTTGVTFESNANKENDKITVVFTDANGIDKVSAETLSNYTLIDLGTAGTSTTVLPLTSETVKSISLVAKTVTITLKTIDLQKDNYYSLKVANVKDVLGNAISADGIIKTTAIIPPAVAATATFTKNDTGAPTVASILGTSASGETNVSVTFSEDVTVASAQDATNYRASTNTTAVGTQTYAPSGTVSYDVATKKATFKVATEFAGTQFNVYVKGVKDLAGNAIASFDTEIGGDNKIATGGTDNFAKATGALADLVPQALSTTSTDHSAVAKDVSAPANDVVTLKFTKPLDTTTAAKESNYTVKINGVAVPNADNAGPDGITQGFQAAVAAGNTVTLTLHVNFNFYKGDTIEVTVNNVRDDKGNPMASAQTVTLTATAAGDAAAKAGVTNKATTALLTSVRAVQLTFQDALKADTLSKDDFTVDNNAITSIDISSAKVIVLNLAAEIANTQAATVRPSATFAIKDSMGNDIDALAAFYPAGPPLTEARIVSSNTVSKAVTPVITVTKKADGSANVYQITTAATNEWSVDGTTWTTGTAGAQDVTIPLAGATVSLRVKASGTVLASDAATKVYAAQAAAPAMANVTKKADGSANVYQITTAATNEWSVDGTTWTTGTAGAQDVTIPLAGATVSLRVKATDDVLASAAATKVYAAQAAAPTGITIDESTDTATKFTGGVDTTMEFSLNGGTSWTAITANHVNGTTTFDTSGGADLRVRVAATNDVLASASTAKLDN